MVKFDRWRKAAKKALAKNAEQTLAENGLLLRHLQAPLSRQHYATMCVTACQENGLAAKFVKWDALTTIQAAAVAWAAVNECPYSLQHIPRALHSPMLYKRALAADVTCLNYVPDVTPSQWWTCAKRAPWFVAGCGRYVPRDVWRFVMTKCKRPHTKIIEQPPNCDARFIETECL